MFVLPKQKESTNIPKSTHATLKTSSLMSNCFDVTNKKLAVDEILGDVIVSADLNGSLKIFINPTRLKTNAFSSSFLD